LKQSYCTSPPKFKMTVIISSSILILSNNVPRYFTDIGSIAVVTLASLQSSVMHFSVIAIIGDAALKICQPLKKLAIQHTTS
jgi:hypothetical protein